MTDDMSENAGEPPDLTYSIAGDEWWLRKYTATISVTKRTDFTAATRPEETFRTPVGPGRLMVIGGKVNQWLPGFGWVIVPPYEQENDDYLEHDVGDDW